jgi:hypothetical protein|eukprot:COSAG01_NODE_4086_length_5369_cov_30.431499_2_plen_116_part_00
MGGPNGSLISVRVLSSRAQNLIQPDNHDHEEAEAEEGKESAGRWGKGGRFRPSVEIPQQAIMRHMAVLAEESCDTPAFRQRMVEVAAVARGLLPAADAFPEGRAIVEGFLSTITA